MKEGWTYKKLGEVCCKSSNIKWDDVSNDASYKYIDLTSVYRTDLRIHDPQIITKENAPSRAKQIVKVGDVIFATTRPTLRRVSLIDDKHDGALCSTGFCVLRPNTDISSKWIFYCLQNNGFYNYIEPLQTGASYPAVTDGIVKGYVIPVPPLDEQQRIVERLDAAFENIDKLKANAEKQLAEAQTLFQKSLAKAMEPKEGWKEKKLKDIAQVRIGPFGSLLHKKDYISGGIPLVNPIHMVNGNIVANNDYTISDVKAKELSNYLLKENDIVFARRGEVGRCAIVTGEDEGFLCGTGSLFVRFLREIDSNFMLMLFQSDYCKNYLEHNASGATMLNINAGIVEDMPLTLPPLAEQQRIVERLDALSENIRKYEEIQRQIISECDALKQALLRKVFE